MLSHISINQILCIQNELFRCYNGTSRYNGNQAEIYISTAMEHSSFWANNPRGEFGREDAQRGLNAIIALCERFSVDFECDVLINDVSVNDFEDTNRNINFYSHRLYVTVVKF